MKKFEWTMVNALALSVLAFVGIYNAFIANKGSFTAEDNSHKPVLSTTTNAENEKPIPPASEKSILIDTSHGAVTLINFTEYFDVKIVEPVTDYINQSSEQRFQLELAPKRSFRGNILAYAFGEKGKICPKHKFCYDNYSYGVKRCLSYRFDVQISQPDSVSSFGPFSSFAPPNPLRLFPTLGSFGPSSPCFESVADLDPGSAKFSFVRGRKINAWIYFPFNKVNRIELHFLETL